MPLPKKNPNEEKNEFLTRCVHDHTMVKEYPNPMQRVAVCIKQWEKKQLLKDFCVYCIYNLKKREMKKYTKLQEATYYVTISIVAMTFTFAVLAVGKVLAILLGTTL